MMAETKQKKNWVEKRCCMGNSEEINIGKD